jgi:hypothetical protein
MANAAYRDRENKLTHFFRAITFSMGISTSGRTRPLGAAILAAVLLAMAPHPVFAQSGDNLPVFTSAMDITGLRAQVRAVAPDRETGRPVDVAFPPGIVGPKFNQFLSTPLSTQFDQYWGVVRDPKNNNMTAREQACNGPDGIVSQIQPEIHKIGSAFNAYDITCDLASTGQLLLQQEGATLILGYQLIGNKVNFKITTPGTCNADHTSFLCPNDPRVSVTFTTQLITTVRAAGICEIFGENATVVTQAVTIDANHNLAGAVATAVDDMFLGHKFRAAERSIESMEKPRPLPLDAAFKELRDSDGCTGRNVLLSRVLKSFSEFEAIVDLRQGIIFTATHPPMTVPSVGVPNPGAPAVASPSQPTFTPPTIAGDRPMVQAGAPLGVSGRFFPPNVDMTRSLPVSIGHNTGILGGPCFGGGTDLRWGPVGNTAVQRLPGNPQVPCATSFSATGLTPFTAYQFSARSCDAVTCSLWSTPVSVRTARVNPDQGKVVLTLDLANQAGSGVTTAPGAIAGPHEPTVKTLGRVNAGTPAGPPRPICDVAREARARNSPAAPGLEAQCRASGGHGATMLQTGNVVLARDVATQVGSGVITDQGTFLTTITIPANAAPGDHRLQAIDGTTVAQTMITISSAAPPGGSSNASIMMVGVLHGETGCPNHSISSTQADASFMLFGTGFEAGGVSVRLDSANGLLVGSAVAQGNGTFCQQMVGVPTSQAGNHKLVAVQNGAIQAQVPATFVVFSGPH